MDKLIPVFAASLLAKHFGIESASNAAYRACIFANGGGHL